MKLFRCCLCRRSISRSEAVKFVGKSPYDARYVCHWCWEPLHRRSHGCLSSYESPSGHVYLESKFNTPHPPPPTEGSAPGPRAASEQAGEPLLDNGKKIG